MWTFKVMFAGLGLLLTAALVTSVAKLHWGQPVHATLLLLAIVSWVGLLGMVLYEALLRRIELLRHQITYEIKTHEERIGSRLDAKYSQIELVRTFLSGVSDLNSRDVPDQNERHTTS